MAGITQRFGERQAVEGGATHSPTIDSRITPTIPNCPENKFMCRPGSLPCTWPRFVIASQHIHGCLQYQVQFAFQRPQLQSVQAPSCHAKTPEIYRGCCAAGPSSVLAVYTISQASDVANAKALPRSYQQGDVASDVPCVCSNLHSLPQLLIQGTNVPGVHHFCRWLCCQVGVTTLLNIKSLLLFKVQQIWCRTFS